MYVRAYVRTYVCMAYVCMYVSMYVHRIIKMIEGSQLVLGICMPSYALEHNMITLDSHPFIDGPSTVAPNFHHREASMLCEPLRTLRRGWCLARYKRMYLDLVNGKNHSQNIVIYVLHELLPMVLQVLWSNDAKKCGG